MIEPIRNQYIPNPRFIQETPRGRMEWDVYSRLAQRPHHLLGHADRRHGRQPDHRPAVDPRVRRSRQGRRDVRQLARRRDHRACSRSTTRCSTSSATCRRSASARPRRPRRCCSRPAPPGKRFILPHARVLIHQPHGGASGQAVDIEIQAKEIIRMRELLDELLAHHTGQPLRPGVEGHRPRLHHERSGGQGVRHRRRGHQQS